MRRIDEDTIVIEEKTLSISELKVQLASMRESNVQAEESNAWRETLPEERKHLVIELPIQDTTWLEGKIAEYEAMEIE